MDVEIGPHGRRRGELLPEAWRESCVSMTRYSLYGYNLFRHAASTEALRMLHLRDARDRRDERPRLDVANCLSRALLGLLYSHEHGLRTRVVRYATLKPAAFMRLSNKRLPESGMRLFNHLSVDPGEDATASQQYDPCDGSLESMAMAVEDFVLMPLWAELTDLLNERVECREYRQYMQTFRNVLSTLQVSLGALFPPKHQTGLLLPAWNFKHETELAARTPVPEDDDLGHA